MNTSIYWPGTKILKSNGNAFTSWKTSNGAEGKSIAKQIRSNGVMTRPEDLVRKKSFIIYSRAKRSS